jgi:hypothetical protein
MRHGDFLRLSPLSALSTLAYLTHLDLSAKRLGWVAIERWDADYDCEIEECTEHRKWNNDEPPQWEEPLWLSPFQFDMELVRQLPSLTSMDMRDSLAHGALCGRALQMITEGKALMAGAVGPFEIAADLTDAPDLARIDLQGPDLFTGWEGLYPGEGRFASGYGTSDQRLSICYSGCIESMKSYERWGESGKAFSPEQSTLEGQLVSTPPPSPPPHTPHPNDCTHPHYFLSNKAGLASISNWTSLNLSNTKIAAGLDGTSCELPALLIQRIASVREQYGPSAVQMSGIWGSIKLPTDLGVLSDITCLDLHGIDALELNLNEVLQELTKLTHLNLADCVRVQRVDLSIHSIIAISKMREANGSSAVDLWRCGPFGLDYDMSGFGLAKMDLSSIRFTGVNVEIFAECTALQSLNLSHTKWTNLEQTDKESGMLCEEWDGVRGDSTELCSKLPDLNELMLEDSLVTYPDYIRSPYIIQSPSSHQPTTTFSACVTEVLEQVHPDTKISTDGMYVLCDMLALILGRLASLTVDLGEREVSGSAVRVDDRAVMGALVLLWSGAELVNHALAEVKKAVVKYDGSEDKSDLRAASGLTVDAKVFRAVGREILQCTLTGNCTVDPKAVVATATVIEYLCAEVLELSGEKDRIQINSGCVVERVGVVDPVHIARAVSNDKELNEVFSSTHTGRLRSGTFMLNDHLPEVSIAPRALS